MTDIATAVIRSELETPPMTGWGLSQGMPQVRTNPRAADDAAADDQRNGKTETTSPLRNVAAQGEALK